MKLSTQHGNSLRVYLALIEARNAQEVCPLSHRALSATIRLSRNTVLQALRQLEQQGLILRKEDGWRPATRPLVDLLAPKGGSEGEPLDGAGGSEVEPSRRERRAGGSKDEPPGSENEPPGPRNGSGIEPLPPEGVQKLNPPDNPPTRTRTLLSSSYEEDNICTAVPPSSSSSSLLPSSGEGRGEEGGLGGEKRREETEETKSPPDSGGENRGEEEERTTSPSRGEENRGEETEGKIPPAAYLSEMQSWWATIAPEDRGDPRPWFTQLWTEFGTEIPLQIFREFVAAGRKRAELKYPDRYQRFFHTCCRNAQSPAEPPSPASDTEAAYENYEARMRAAYLADDAQEAAAFENWEEKLRAGYQADDAREAAAFENGEAKLKAGYQADDARTAADFQARLGSLLAAQESAHADDPDHVLAPFRAERRRS